MQLLIGLLILGVVFVVVNRLLGIGPGATGHNLGSAQRDPRTATN